MTSDRINPYAAPLSTDMLSSEGNLDPVTRKKVEAIIKDAGQFWLAIILCILCSGVGAVLIAPWYLVRLSQWNSIARAQPHLVDPDAPRRSLAQRFQAAKRQLIIGTSVGGIIFLLSLIYFMRLVG